MRIYAHDSIKVLRDCAHEEVGIVLSQAFFLLFVLYGCLSGCQTGDGDEK